MSGSSRSHAAGFMGRICRERLEGFGQNPHLGEMKQSRFRGDCNDSACWMG